ncbi:MAG: thioredoxin domain-containing protein [Truepera sp.]|nr:thioredoxin domain-containing protein [Truepera sp.]
MNPRRLTLLTVVVVVLAVVTALVVARLRGNAPAEFNLDGQPSLGDASASVEIALFEDFLCPHCATFTESIFPLLKRDFVDTGQARIYFVNFPVLGPGSERIARASECVYHQSESAFWDLKEAMFRSPSELDNSRRIVEFAEVYAPGIDSDALHNCIGSSIARKEVARDTDLARSLGLNSTPSVTVNGVQVTNLSLNRIRVAVERALAAVE